MNLRYTSSELKAKYTVQDAMNAAQARLNGMAMCVNAVAKLDRNKLINLKELNELADNLVDDSYYHANY